MTSARYACTCGKPGCESCEARVRLNEGTVPAAVPADHERRVIAAAIEHLGCYEVRGNLLQGLQEDVHMRARVLAFAAALATSAPPPVEAREPTEQQAHDVGAKGSPPDERERALFEAWMRGHCWALCATWDGKQYLSDTEKGGALDPHAMATRRLWAAWRDRAALAKLAATHPKEQTAESVHGMEARQQ
jgi:hypothetical protein